MVNIFADGMFTHSTLVFPNFWESGEVDAKGNPSLSPLQNITVTAQLDREGVGRVALTGNKNYDPTQEKFAFYKGHIIEIVGGDLPAVGTQGRATINGNEGDIKLLPTPQASINIASDIFGSRIRVLFWTTIDFHQ